MVVVDKETCLENIGGFIMTTQLESYIVGVQSAV
jgi:hypothetical protein